MNLASAFASNRRYHHVARTLADRIVRGDFPSGHRLPPERELAQDLDVSRTTLREGLIALELMNFVEIRTGSGIYVLPGAARGSGDMPLSANEPGPFELLELRRIVEGRFAALAAQRAREIEIEAIGDNIARMRAALDDLPAFDTADRDFHRLIAEASGNSLAAGLVSWLWGLRTGAMWRRWYAQTRKRTNRERSVADHDAIHRAIHRRLPDMAETAMQAHVDILAERFLDLGLKE